MLLTLKKDKPGKKGLRRDSNPLTLRHRQICYHYITETIITDLVLEVKGKIKKYEPRAMGAC